MAPRMRDDLQGMEPYDPDLRDVEVVLSANENSFGLPEAVCSEMARRLAAVPANRYPDATACRLRALLGDMWGVSARSVAVGNGGDELIFNLLLAFGGPGRTMVNCVPTFSAYALYARLTGTSVKNVRRRAEDFSLDEGAVLAAASDADLVFVTSPNNPTGNLVRSEFVRCLAAASDALVVVDEAYADFADPAASCIPLASEFPNVCVLKTLSKAYALAGARVGFVVAPPAVVDALFAVRQPYSVSSLDQVAAETVVEMRDALAPACDALVAGRSWLETRLCVVADELAARGGGAAMRVYPSEANFVLVRLLPGASGLPDADAVHESLASGHSVLVRNFSHVAGLEGCLRITVGTPRENARLLGALRAVLGLPANPDDEPADGAEEGC